MKRKRSSERMFLFISETDVLLSLQLTVFGISDLIDYHLCALTIQEPEFRTGNST